MTTSPPRERSAIHERLARYGSAHFLRLYAIGGCIALLSGLVISYVALVAAGNAGGMQTDFVSYYSAAHLTATGAGAHIYNLAAFGQYERGLVHPLTVQNGVLPYVYPPFLAVLMAPLGALPYTAAWGLWLGINVLLTVVTVASFQRYLSLDRVPAILLWAASLSFLPIFVAIAQGQTSILLLALLAGAFFAARSRHPWTDGVLLSLALIKPQYVLPILLVLAIRRHWASLVTFTISTVVLFVAPMVILGPGSDAAYLHTLRLATGWHGQFGYAPSLNQSVLGFMQLLVAPAIALAMTAVIALVAAGALARVALRSPGLDIPFGLAVITAVVLSPHVLIHDLSLLLLPIVIAVRYRVTGPSHLTPLLLAGSAAVLAGMRLSSVIPIQLSVLAMLALGVWLYRVNPKQCATAVRPEPASRHQSPLSRPHSLLEDV